MESFNKYVLSTSSELGSKLGVEETFREAFKNMPLLSWSPQCRGGRHEHRYLAARVTSADRSVHYVTLGGLS